MKLYEHQLDALEATKGFNRVAYYHDMGLGKTFTGAEKMIRLAAKTNLLICQKSKICDWIEHFLKNYGLKVYDLTLKKELGNFIGVLHSGAGILGVINYELAWRRPELLKLKDFTLMLDESSLIQNRNAKQTKFILNLQPKNMILLSGTPTAGKYENLWTQIHLLGWDISERLYQQQYVNWKLLQIPGERFVKVVDKSNPYKNVERLKAKMREHGAVFLKTEEVMDLPTQNFVEIKVPKSKEYNKFMKDSIIQIDGEELVGDTNLTKRLYARQLCGRYNKSKLDAFRDLIQSTNDRLIVFYNFTAELAELEAIANDLERPFSLVNGSCKRLDEYESDDNSITFVQYQAGSMGLNLQKANKIIYFTPPERCELWMQSQKRIHRIGQERPCFYYKMICSGSIEESIYKALERGTDFTDELFKEVINNR